MRRHVLPFFHTSPIFLSILLLFLGFTTFSVAQQYPIASVPADPHELVTGVVKVLDETDQRATVLGLVERARQNSDLHAPSGHPFNLKVSFDASGDVAQTGRGQMEETWLGVWKWRWTGSLGSYAQTRIMNGKLYDENPSTMPLRLQMVRGAIFWPIHMGPNELLRISPGTWNGSAVMCVLSSQPRYEAQKVAGRAWEESEFCIDTKSGLLQTFSPAPGLYAVYDYQNAAPFHASVLPRTITFFASGTTVLTIHLDSIADAGEVDGKLLTPSEKMQSQTAGPVIAGGFHWMAAGGASAAVNGAIQPLIVHALVNPEGKVEEAEALQTANSALAATALSVAKNKSYGQQEQGRLFQREVFIDVRFVPPAAAQRAGK